MDIDAIEDSRRPHENIEESKKEPGHKDDTTPRVDHPPHLKPPTGVENVDGIGNLGLDNDIIGKTLTHDFDKGEPGHDIDGDNKTDKLSDLNDNAAPDFEDGRSERDIDGDGKGDVLPDGNFGDSFDDVTGGDLNNGGLGLGLGSGLGLGLGLGSGLGLGLGSGLGLGLGSGLGLGDNGRVDIEYEGGTLASMIISNSSGHHATLFTENPENHKETKTRPFE